MPDAPQTDTPPPRRNWHLARWFLVLAIATFGGSAWQAYAFRSALKEAEAIGWSVRYTDPVETIRQDWKAAFKKATWLDGVTLLNIATSESFEQHLAIAHRLNTQWLRIGDAHTLRDLSPLKPLTRLKKVEFYSCTGLANVDALKNLSTLHWLWLNGCTGLMDVDGLKNLSALKEVLLDGCAGLTNVNGLRNLTALEGVSLNGCAGLTNVDVLKNLSAMKELSLFGCTGLTNVDGLKNLSALQSVRLDGCTGLTNVEGLKSCRSLKWVALTRCTGLTPESVAALKAALPNTQIIGR
jgi:hypothetical protein